MFVHCCHCRDCQRQTGSAFVINALIETERIVLLAGEHMPVAVPTDSGRPPDRPLPGCHIALWSEYGGRPGLRFVRVGTLDDPAAIRPDVHIYNALESALGHAPGRGALLPRILRDEGALAGGKPAASVRRLATVTRPISAASKPEACVYDA